MQVTRREFLSGAMLAAGTTLAGCGGSDNPPVESEGSVSVNGQQLHYTALGRGAPVIFMHGGLGFDHQYFRPFLDDLARDATLVYYDHLGHGRSDRPANYADITLARLSDDCDRLASQLGFGKFVLVGHSFGGFIALDFALRFPNRLAGLVLTCTAPDLASFNLRNPLGGTVLQQAALGRLFGGAAAIPTDQALRANWTGAVPLYYNNATPPAGVLADVDSRTIYSADAFNRGNEMLGGYDFVPRLSTLRVPTAVHYGTGDIWRFGDTEKLASNIPGATLKYFANSGHWPFQEETSAYIDHVRRFIAAR